MLIDIFDKQIEKKINNMKRLIYGVALIGIASVGFAFMNNQETKKELQSEWCVKLLCDGKSFYVTVIARGPISAREKALEIYPKCTGGYSPTQGRCK